MKTRTKAIAFLVAAAAAVGLTWALPRWIKPEPGVTYSILDPGWQLYAKPTTLEPPGTIFRIDRDGRRYLVDQLRVETMAGDEVMPSTRTAVRVDAGVAARALGASSPVQLASASQSFEELQFEMLGTRREAITDAALEPVLVAFAKKVSLKADNKYFVIREVRSAEEIRYFLTGATLQNLGGKAVLDGFARLGGSVERTGSQETTLKQKFPARMRVLFLPERIVQTSAGLSGTAPTFGTVAVKEPLRWTE